MRGKWKSAALCVGSIVSMTTVAHAQPLGTFTWQLQPYCNRIIVNVTQTGGVYALDGYDDQCGFVRRASVVGTAFQNPNLTIGLAMTIVTTPGGAPVHVDARIDLQTLSGLWFDSATGSGSFAFNGPGGGPARPLGARSGPIEINADLNAQPEIRLNGGVSDPLDIIGYRVGGSVAAPTATPGDATLLNVGGGGYGGTQYTGPTGAMYVLSRQTFTDTGHGTALIFTTTPNGTTSSTTRLTVDQNGNVGIGATFAAEKLQVLGDVRVGTSGANGCLKSFGGGTITGSCSSDGRFKRDITPFAPALDAVAQLRPVHHYWRAAEFPTKGFGSQQSYGLIAQEVAEVLPELVTTDAAGYHAVDYAKLPLLAIKAITELKERNDALERRLAALEAALTYERK